jgi:hypothetical protein
VPSTAAFANGVPTSSASGRRLKTLISPTASRRRKPSPAAARRPLDPQRRVLGDGDEGAALKLDHAPLAQPEAQEVVDAEVGADPQGPPPGGTDRALGQLGCFHHVAGDAADPAMIRPRRRRGQQHGQSAGGECARAAPGTAALPAREEHASASLPGTARRVGTDVGTRRLGGVVGRHSSLSVTPSANAQHAL